MAAGLAQETEDKLQQELAKALVYMAWWMMVDVFVDALFIAVGSIEFLAHLKAGEVTELLQDLTERILV